MLEWIFGAKTKSCVLLTEQIHIPNSLSALRCVCACENERQRWGESFIFWSALPPSAPVLRRRQLAHYLLIVLARTASFGGGIGKSALERHTHRDRRSKEDLVEASTRIWGFKGLQLGNATAAVYVCEANLFQSASCANWRRQVGGGGYSLCVCVRVLHVLFKHAAGKRTPTAPIGCGKWLLSSFGLILQPCVF